MNQSQFEHALNLYGGDIDRWPPPMRAEAEALVRTDPAAQQLLDRSARLEALLAGFLPALPVDAALVGRIVAGVDRDMHRETAVRPTRRLMAWAGAAMAGFLIVGFVIGLALPDTSGDDTYAELMFGTGGLIIGDDVL